MYFHFQQYLNIWSNLVELSTRFQNNYVEKCPGMQLQFVEAKSAKQNNSLNCFFIFQWHSWEIQNRKVAEKLFTCKQNSTFILGVN